MRIGGDPMTLEITEQGPSYGDLLVELGAERAMNELLVEAVSDLELSAEDRGWRVASMRLEQEFSRQGLGSVIDNCRLMSIASPLTKRGLQLRVGYVWGQGVTVQARAAEAAASDGGQDVNAVVQAFWDDASNQVSLTSSEARETNERTLGTDGNLCFAFFPDPLTGRVQVRTIPFQEIQDKISNPDDRDDIWFFYRQYTTSVVEAGYAGTTRRRTETRRVLHPALGFWPVKRPKSIDGIPVVWDQPILHVSVNRPAHWKWGIPDAYAALPWARAYDGFLTDWAKLVKALSKFAWKLTGDRSTRARRAAEKLQASFPGRLDTEAALAGQGTGDAGGVAGMGPGVNLEAIPKSGATIDSGSGKPLAAMVAAALGVSVVDLLADPGITGARAVAETMDKPVVLEMSLRRELWKSVLQTITGYVIEQAVRAPRGPLTGTVVRDPRTGRETITLAGDVEPTVEVKFPDLNELDPVQLVAAIVDADGTGKLPDQLTCKLLLQALKVDDVDEILDELFDEDGQWKEGMEPTGNAGQAAADRFKRGEDFASIGR
jgi:hypothetical protein